MTQVIIFGSSRSFGHTRKVIDDILGSRGINLFDLNNFDISPFDYEHRNSNDDFIPLIEKLIEYDTDNGKLLARNVLNLVDLAGS